MISKIIKNFVYSYKISYSFYIQNSGHFGRWMKNFRNQGLFNLLPLLKNSMSNSFCVKIDSSLLLGASFKNRSVFLSYGACIWDWNCRYRVVIETETERVSQLVVSGHSRRSMTLERGSLGQLHRCAAAPSAFQLKFPNWGR